MKNPALKAIAALFTVLVAVNAGGQSCPEFTPVEGRYGSTSSVLYIGGTVQGGHMGGPPVFGFTALDAAQRTFNWVLWVGSSGLGPICSFGALDSGFHAEGTCYVEQWGGDVPSTFDVGISLGSWGPCPAGYSYIGNYTCQVSDSGICGADSGSTSGQPGSTPDEQDYCGVGNPIYHGS